MEQHMLYKEGEVAGHLLLSEESQSKLQQQEIVPDTNVIKHAREATQGLRDYLHTQFGSGFAPAQPNDRSTIKAQQVFSCPELLELILLHLPPVDLLQVQQVSQVMAASIASSSKLQCHLHLHGDEHSLFTPFCLGPKWDLAAFKCFGDTIRGKMLSIHPRFLRRSTPLDHEALEISATFSSGKNLPQLGERCRSMLICQPPLKEMKPETSCCQPFRSSGRTSNIVPESVKSKTGLTVGDILDATHKLMDEHHLCPHSPVYCHNDDGFVDCSPKFRGTLWLQPDDPAFKKYRKRERDEKEARSKEIAKQSRFLPYMQAKVNGKSTVAKHLSQMILLTIVAALRHGLPIPKLAEFEASDAQDS